MATGTSKHAERFLEGGGEMGALIRAYDWGSTPLGPVERWPQSLRSAVSILLPSKAQIAMFWGEDLITLYNDAYRPVFGAKHPGALGKPIREAWEELWRAGLKELFDGVLSTGEAFWAQDMPFFMERHGYLEETYFDVSYDPVRDESGRVGGVFCIVAEKTGRVLGERRLRTLRDLGRIAQHARSVAQVYPAAIEVLARSAEDIPFALLYGAAAPGEPAPLMAQLGAATAGGASWPLGEEAQVVSGAALAAFGELHGGPWPEPVREAVSLPFALPGQAPAGHLVAGVSPRRRLDDATLDFLRLVAANIASALAAARRSEDERIRAEQLAELDRAKTAFFSNVSHEFRTPLTLMLGPLEDALADAAAPLAPAQRERLELTRRSGLRLQKLVNSLLDFARIEAGRAQAAFAPTDLAALTADLASSFRSAIERAGLRLAVACRPLGEPAWVDRDMWEKIVLNLLSNAFKFTFEGEIAVSLAEKDGRIELCVRDTGTGIPAADLPHVFERFRRVEGARSRTHEGTGIGLSLVQELVKLHGGEIRVESVEGKGSTFTVSIPTGRAHLPAEGAGEVKLASTALGAEAFVEEALRWLPDAAPAPAAPAPAAPRAGPRERIVWADDNADMREYVRRLLGERYEVEAVADGEAALAAVQARRPDLVLADVMMPRLDGLGLVRRLRADPLTRALPVILLSARAGEESRIEGLDAGADDYLHKPFSARELLARVSARLELARLQARLEREGADMARLFAQTPLPIAVVRGPELVFELANPAYLAVIGEREVVGKPLAEALPELRGQGFDELLHKVMRSGAPHVGHEVPVRLARKGRIEDTYFTFIYAPLRNAAGETDAVVAICSEVTEQVRAREAIAQSERRYRNIFETAGVAIFEEDFTAVKAALDALAAAGVRDLRRHLQENPALVREMVGRVQVRDVNDAALRMFGAKDKAELLASLERIFVPESEAVFAEELIALAAGQPLFEGDAVLRTLQGERRNVLLRIAFGAATPENVLVTMMDITERTRAEAALREADRRKDEFLATLSHELRNPLAPIRNAVTLVRETGEAEVRQQASEILERQVAHMVRLVDDLLDISRISRGTLELRRERVELAALVRNAIETADPLIRAGGHRLSLALPREPVWLDGDPVRLAQVLANLLNNAAKYTDAGGEIALRARRQAGAVEIAVHDNGAGIAPEALARLFEMFSRGAHPGERAQGGLGVGLALARRLAQMHGGTIEAHSDGPGKGAEFVLRLPAAADQRPARMAADARAAPIERQRILVVDDNRDAADSLGMILTYLGAEVRVARDGAEALEAFGAYDPAVVLLDVGMPGMDGYEVARRIRERFPARRAAIVALTGWGQEEYRRRSREAGFDHHLVKPAEIGALRGLLASLEAGRRVEH